MCNFTKGPWQYADGNEIVYSQEGDVVCDTVGATTREHQDYNAHLIAVAPEMYEMLEKILAEYKAIMLGESSAVSDIEQLLSKARGEHV